MEIALYKFKEKYNPIAYLCEIWCKLYGIDLQIVYSSFSWSSAGTLPVLRVNQYVYTTENIIPILKTLLNIDEDLKEELLPTYSMIEEICTSRLHSSTLYKIWVPSEVSKYFAYYQTGYVGRVVNSLKHIFIKKNILNYLAYHGVTSDLQAFIAAESSHKILSQVLGNHRYFSTQHSGVQRPHSVDLIVYVYLFEELSNLVGSTHIEDSFANYPNLQNFVKNIEYDINQQQFQNFVSLNYDQNHLKLRAFKLGGKIETVDKENDLSTRRNFVAACSIVLFGFLLSNN